MKVYLTQVRHRNTQDNHRDLLLTERAYRRFGTIQDAADHLGLSPTTVGLRLRKGARLGLYTYRGRRRYTFTRQQLREVLGSATSVAAAAHELSTTPQSLRAAVRALGLTAFYEQQRQRMEALEERDRMDRVAGEYRALVRKAGRELSATDFVRLKERSLYASILNLYGSLDEFRKALRIAAPDPAPRRKRHVVRTDDPRNYALAYCANLQSQLRREPTALDLQDHRFPERRAIYGIVLRHWGGIDAFRRSLRRYVHRSTSTSA